MQSKYLGSICSVLHMATTRSGGSSASTSESGAHIPPMTAITMPAPRWRVASRTSLRTYIMLFHVLGSPSTSALHRTVREQRSSKFKNVKLHRSGQEAQGQEGQTSHKIRSNATPISGWARSRFSIHATDLVINARATAGFLLRCFVNQSACKILGTVIIHFTLSIEIFYNPALIPQIPITPTKRPTPSPPTQTILYDNI